MTGLKLDKSFIQDVPAEADASAIAVAVITLACNLCLSVTAKEVENRSQLSFLRDAVCHSFQGYLFEQPMEPEETVAWLDQRRGEPPRPASKPSRPC